MTLTDEEIERIEKDFANDKSEYVTTGWNTYKVLFRVFNLMVLQRVS